MFGYCEKCNEALEGDGYVTVLHCPNADDDKVDGVEPDANPIFCDFED